MSGYQRVVICGNVGKDPEIRSFTNGGKIANFSIATSETWKDKTTGEKKERTEWHRISVKNDHLIEVVEKYVKKGGQVLIEGILETRKWEKDGVDHYTTEIVIKPFNGSLTLMGSKKGGAPEASPAATHKGMDAQGDLAGTQASTLADMDDPIPF